MRGEKRSGGGQGKADSLRPCPLCPAEVPFWSVRVGQRAGKGDHLPTPAISSPGLAVVSPLRDCMEQLLDLSGPLFPHL